MEGWWDYRLPISFWREESQAASPSWTRNLSLGCIARGRNSGVLHAGLYYKPGSLKAKVCVEGAKRLRSWVEERGLPLNPCGKVIVPQRAELDAQLDVLAERGRANGAEVEDSGTQINCEDLFQRLVAQAVELYGVQIQPL